MSDQEMIIKYSADINDAEKPEPLPEGEYIGEIREVTTATSGKGLHYATPMFFISPDQYPADYVEGDPDGTVLRGFVSLADNPKARYGMQQFCKTINAPVTNDVDMTEWIGQSATLIVVHQLYEGEPQANIKKVTAVQ